LFASGQFVISSEDGFLGSLLGGVPWAVAVHVSSPLVVLATLTGHACFPLRSCAARRITIDCPGYDPQSIVFCLVHFVVLSALLFVLVVLLVF
jgi:hypothetical protein